MSSEPRTLMQAIRHYADEQVAFDFVVGLRWSDGELCPHCSGTEHSFLTTRRIWKCKTCKRQFSVKVGTIFEDSPIKLGTWLCAIWMIANAKNGVSSHEIARSLGVTQKTAWFMSHRIRLAMQTGTFQKLSDEVEADETFVDGKRSNMHAAKKRTDGVKGTRGSVDKTVVMGILKRDDEVRTKTVKKIMRGTLQSEVLANVEPGSVLYTDALASYEGLGATCLHQTIDHKVSYVEGQIHTNGIENFWSLFKRCIKGTHIHLDPAHLDAYLDEEVFRFNNRHVTDAARCAQTVAQVSGKRLTYTDLKGRN